MYSFLMIFIVKKVFVLNCKIIIKRKKNELDFGKFNFF